MSVEENKATVRGYLEMIWGERRLDLFSDYLAKAVLLHTPEELLGRDGMKQRVDMILNMFTGFVQTIDDEIAEGDKVVIRWTRSGTYKGGMLGRTAVRSGTSIFRLAGGKIVEVWVESDCMSVM